MPAVTREVPILMYHQVSVQPVHGLEKYTVTVQNFAAQMKWLRGSGHNSITFEDWLDARSGRRSLPRRPVIITFDDGFRDCVNHVVPIMADRGFFAMFYLVAGLVGSRSEWLIDRGIGLPLVDWAEARALLRAGFHCGSHTVTHPRLSEVTPDRCRQELQDSRRILEDGLGCEVRHLCYPYGSFDGTVRGMVQEAGYRSACSVHIGLSDATSDVLALPRVPVTGYDSLPDFICKLHTAQGSAELLRGKVRGTLRTFRRAFG